MGIKQTYVPMTYVVKYIIYTSCSDAHVQEGSGGSKKVDPKLKLFFVWPVIITDNLDVKFFIVN